MLLEEKRKELVEIGLRAINEGLTTGTGGNFSVCDRESGLMCITPSGVPYIKTKPENIIVMDIQTGKIVEGDGIPSSECDMHRIFYKYRTDINAVIHTHTTYASTYSCFRRPLPAIHYLTAFGGLEVNCAEYATYGTVALAKNAFEAMKGNNACLLANHGLLAGADTLDMAYGITEQLELCCKMYLTCMALSSERIDPVILPREEMELMVERFKGYGKVYEKHDEEI
ncbi:MAG: L-fuculose-phosphate aldolase [Clostridia bacterium]|nr:L-fuculose-phosphate aldolase [Clostridia bacterium]